MAKKVNGESIRTKGAVIRGRVLNSRILESQTPIADGITIELFAGAGGLTLGLAAAGLAPDHIYELDANCCETLRHNSHGPTPHITATLHQADVAEVDWSSFTHEPVYLLSAGPPCQPFSMAGKHQADRDGRNQFPAILRAMRTLTPSVVLIENVPGMLRNSFGPYLAYTIRRLKFPSVGPRPRESWSQHDERVKRHERTQDPEYNVVRWILNAADHGVAQSRVRVFFVASRAEIDADPRHVGWVQDLADELTPKRAFRDYNYAVLDFTMKICVAGRPRCGECPVAMDCQYGSGGCD